MALSKHPSDFGERLIFEPTNEFWARKIKDLLDRACALGWDLQAEKSKLEILTVNELRKIVEEAERKMPA